jgi:hypothetical protein
MNRRQTTDAAPDVVRLVLGGFDESARLQMAYAELREAGLNHQQLCVFRLSDQIASETDKPPLLHERSLNGIRLLISSAMLFDCIRLAEAAPYGDGAPWMPARQAAALWGHIRKGWPALLAGTRSSDEQIACSHVQLRHRPRFLHTFNFSRDR